MFPVVLVPSKILGSSNAVCNPVSPPVIGVKTEAARRMTFVQKLGSKSKNIFQSGEVR